MKVLLIRPAQYFKIGLAPKGPRFSIPLGILSIGSFLERNNLDINIFDFLAETENNILFNFNSAIKQHNNETLYCGTSDEHFFKIFNRLTPQLIGITNPFIENLDISISLAKKIKKLNPNVIIVLGGACATIHRKNIIMDNSCIDYIIKADGEIPMLNLINSIQNGFSVKEIKGLCFKNKAEEYFDNPIEHDVKELDRYGELNFDLLKMDNYHILNEEMIFSRNKNLFLNQKSISLITSKGCPYSCSFCSVSQISGNSFRYYTSDKIITQIEKLKNNYGITHFHFEDDNISYEPARFENLLDQIIQKKLNITWDTPNGIHHENLDPELLLKIKKSGCQYIILGIESRNKKILKEEINKKIDFEKINQIIKTANKIKLPLHAFFIIGFPSEKKRQILQTIYYAIRLYLSKNVIPHLSILRPDEGTRIYKNAIAKNLVIKNHNYKNPLGFKTTTYSRNIIKSKNFSPTFLENVISIFYLNIIVISIVKFIYFSIVKKNFYSTSRRIYKEIKSKTGLKFRDVFPSISWNYLYFLIN